MALARWMSGVVVALVLSLSSSLARAQDDAPDIVFLKNGGRVRGTVVEESPTAGVRVKLVTGSLKTVPAAEVDRVAYGAGRASTPTPPSPTTPPGVPTAPPAASTPEPPARQGEGLPPVAHEASSATSDESPASMHIEAAKPGMVYVDGGEVGPAPQDVKGLAPGTHQVRVVFNDGGKTDTRVFLQAGEKRDVQVTLAAAQRAGAARHGVHAFAAVEPYMSIFELTNPGHSVGGGVRFYGGVNIGLVPAIDFRAGGQFALSAVGGGRTSDFAAPFQLRTSFRFNLGSIYSMEVGGHGGFIVLRDPIGGTLVWGAGGPDLSILSFRFGNARQFELTALNSLEFVHGTDFIGMQNSLGFTWVIGP